MSDPTDPSDTTEGMTTKERVIEGDRKAFAAEHGTQPESRAPEGGFEVEPDPLAETVGESENRRGEDVLGEDGKEPGRFDKGTKGESDRPYGGSTPRDATSVGQTDDAESATDTPGAAGR